MKVYTNQDDYYKIRLGHLSQLYQPLTIIQLLHDFGRQQHHTSKNSF